WTPDQGFMVDPFVALATAARTTHRMRLGVGVTSPYMRHPVQIARAAASLSNMTHGRFVLGFGAGEKVRIRDPMGAPVGPFLTVMQDTFTTLRGLLNGKRVTVENSAFRLHDIGLEMQVAHHIPIYLATTRPSAFRLAGAHADGVIIGDVSDPAVMATIIGWLEEGALQAGRTLADIDVLAWVSTVVTTDPDGIRERLRRRVVATALAAMSRVTRGLLGVDEAQIPQIMAARRDAAVPLSPDAIPDSLVDKVTLVGDAATIAARIAALEAVGVNTMGFRMPVALQEHISFSENIERLQRDVMGVGVTSKE
ncbi:MAG: LLM class flavin-dependent oxidoreductase, partial [Chromatiales bacterium]|nr:LLM class flavin-dependent oxidoreductase [Chromatiales bacterium]